MLMLSSRFWLENKMVYPQIFSVMTIYEEKRSTFRIFINKKKIELNECMLMTSGLAINGEIYEKDIISHIDNPSVLGVVEYSFDKGGFIAKMGDKEINIGGDMSDYEIVGNTYETPELVPGFISNSNVVSPTTDKTIVDDTNNKTSLNTDNNKKTTQKESEKSNSDNKIQEKVPDNKTQQTQQNKQQQSEKQTTANTAVSDNNNTPKQEPKQEIKQQSQKQEPKEVKETQKPKSEAPKKEEIKKENKQDNKQNKAPQKQEQTKEKNDTKNNPSVKQLDKKENEKPSDVDNESLNQKGKDKPQTSKPAQNKNDAKEVLQKQPNSNKKPKTAPAENPQQKQQPKQPQTQGSILNSLFSQASKAEKPKTLSEAIGNSKERKVKMYLKAEYLSDIKTGKLGYYIECNGFILKKLHTVEKTTERRTVLMTLIAALKEITYPCHITIFCNIHFIISPIKEGWLAKWAQNNWRHANGAIKDADLWAEIYDICKQHEIICQYEEDMNKFAEYRILSDLF